MAKLLSVIVPSYNVEQYLKKTVESFLKCKTLSEIELIIVSDGSTDKTVEIANKYKEEYPETVVVIDKENGGHGSTINSGLKVAKGKYLIVVDGDDWIDANAIDLIVKQLRNVEVDVAISGHYRNYMNEGTEEHRGYNETTGEVRTLKYLLDKGYQIPMTDTCYRTEMLREIGLQIQEKTYYVDEEFCTIPYLKANRFLFTGQSYYHYRLGSTTQSVSPDNMVKRVDHRLRVFNKLFNILNTAQFNVNSREYFVRRLSAVVNTTYLIYYVYYSNRKEGRILGDNFYIKLCGLNKELAVRTSRIRNQMRLLNMLHVSHEGYELFKKIIR